MQWPHPSHAAPARLAALLLALFGAFLLVGCGGGDEPASEPVDEAPAAAEPEPAPEPDAPERPPPPPAPTTGALEVVGAEGAMVFLGGRQLGSAPGRWEDLDAGTHDLRVERENFHPFEAEITIRAGRTRSVPVDLAEMLGSIVVDSNPPGAMVFLDRNFKGNAPVTIGDLQPREYRLTVSAEGYEVQNRRVHVERAPVRERFDLVAPTATLDVNVEVVHKHRFGSCSGVLHVGPEGFDYRTDHRDAFQLPFAQVEAFEFDYIANNLRLKVLGGRTYNFESPTDDRDALFVFHGAVTEFRESQQD